ncbi:hypothetical protein [uncultured Nocardioides sp.]|uniref:hypothetical protein n=1 Tax=uncultured Nocardioides sp. TaxID=198441 RepID=UPI00261FA4C8|nr:hypothetical protein [uncultured Nocardioides sp.]
MRPTVVRHASASLLVTAALVVTGCAAEAPVALEGDCHARLRVAGEELDPVGADPTGRRGDPGTAMVVGCDEEAVAEVRARPVTRDGDLLGYDVPRGDYRGFYSADSLVEPVG